MLARMSRLVAMLGVVLTAVAVAAAPANAVFMNRDQYMPFEAGSPSWIADNDHPLNYTYYSPSLTTSVPLEFDQRQMSFGQTLTNSFRPYVLVWNATTKKYEKRPCGSLEFVVTRYQNYRLQWRMPNGQVTTFLSRGGLVADGGRPMVGVFFRYAEGSSTRDQVVIQTYAYNQSGQVINAWIAAGSAASTHDSSITVGRNGVFEESPPRTIFAASTSACG